MKVLGGGMDERSCPVLSGCRLAAARSLRDFGDRHRWDAGLIPSAMNLAIGTFSLVTVSFPKHRARLIAKIRGLRGPGFDRTRREILLALGAQAFLGAFAAGLAI
jgi:hypothetical protein